MPALETTTSLSGLKNVFEKLRHDAPLLPRDLNCLVNFIDTFVTVSTHSPTVGDTVAKYVTEVQKHHHTKTCRKHSSVCRFNYPKPPSPFTIIQVPIKNTSADKKMFIEGQKVIKAVLDLCQKPGVVDSIMAKFDKKSEAPGVDHQGQRIARIQELCRQADVSYSCYVEALKYSKRGYTYTLARDVDETMINPFNPEWLLSWNANLDLQPVLDFYQVITYITNYYSKSDVGTTQAIMTALKDKDCPDIKDKLKLVASVYTGSREINESEAAYRLLPQLQLSSSSVKCKHAVTGPKELRSSMWRPASQKVLEMGVNCVKLDGQEGLWYEQPDLWSKYLRRPDSLEHLCYAQFVKMYDGTSSQEKQEDEDDDPDALSDDQVTRSDEDDDANKWNYIMTVENNGSQGSELPLLIELRDPIPGEASKMKRRRHPAALRFHKVRQDKEADKFMLNELMLYRPTRDEFQSDDLFELYHEQHLGQRKVDIVKSQVMEYLESVEEARLMMAEAEKEMDQFLADIGGALDPQGQQDNDECEDEGQREHPDYLHLDPSLIVEPSSNQKKSSPFVRIVVPPQEDLFKKIASLDKYQKEVINVAVKFAKDTVKARKLGNSPPPAECWMVHGGAGAGKSFVINVLTQMAHHILVQEGDNVDQPYVLKTAFTGTAASNIEGSTLSTTFGLKYGNGSSNYSSMSDEKRNKRQSELANLKILVIDEISMVKSDTLYEIDMRLQEIKHKRNVAFGGVMVICFGDLMQLKPVAGRWIFQPPKNQDQWGVQFEANNRWADFKCILLEKNHCQGNDKKYAEMLNRIRVGEQNQNDINELRKRIKPADDEALKDATLYIGCTKRFVVQSNKLYVRSLPGPLITLKARHHQANRPVFKPQINPTSGVVGTTAFLDEIIIKEKAKIILINNLDTSDCLTNGQLGQLVTVIRTPAGDDIDKLVIKFSNPNVGKKWRQENPMMAAKYQDCVVVERVMFSYSLTRGLSEGATATVYQFPIWVAAAITAHKIQGQTVPAPQTVVINMQDMLPNPASLVYVMLSRVQCLDQVYILNDFDEDVIRADGHALNETDRLKEISWNEDPTLQGHFTSWMKPDKRPLKIASMNCASLSRKIQFMKNDDKLLMADVLNLQETWLYPDDRRDLDLPSHRCHHFVNVGKGKGIASYSKELVHAESVKEDNFQVSKLTVRGLDSINVYRSQAGRETDLLAKLERLIDREASTLITGDFNICTMDKPDNIVTATLRSWGFKLMMNEATHILGGHIDHIYWHDPTGHWECPETERYSPFYTDHDALLITLSKKV